MKKVNYFLVFLFVIIASLKANAFNITVNVDDASRVTVYLGSYNIVVFLTICISYANNCFTL